MEKKFTYGGDDYVVYQEHGATMYVNGRKSTEWVVRRVTESGREFAGKIYVPMRKGVVTHAKEWLAA